MNWANGPVKNVTKTPLCGGQWRRNDGKYELVITTNVQHPEIPVGGESEDPRLTRSNGRAMTIPMRAPASSS